MQSGFVNVAKILGIEEGLETESDQANLIDKICEKFSKLEAVRNGSKIDLGANSDSLSADRNQGVHSNESQRTSQRAQDETNGGQMLSPQAQRQRKKQPKQKQSVTEGGPSIKQSPAPNQGAGSLPMKLNEIRDSYNGNDVDSETEERQQIAQDRMRLKKNISATGNYTLQKVGTTVQPAQSSTTAGEVTKEEKGGRASSVHGAKPGQIMEKFKKNNLTAANPIIGAPLGTQSQSQKQLTKLGGSITFKSKEAQSATGKLAKPALANSKIPKYVKKTIKFKEDGDIAE